MTSRTMALAAAPFAALLCLVASIGPARGEASGDAAGDADSLLAAARAAYAKRAAPEESAKALELYQEAIDAGAGYPALWEGARAAADRGSSRMPGAKLAEVRAVYKRGVDWAKQAVKVRPDGAEGHLYLAITLGHHAKSQSFLHQMGVAGDIRKAAERAVKLDPRAECGTPLRVLGQYYFHLPDAFGGDNQEALRLLERAVKICPNDPDAHLDYAEILEAVGQRDKAIEEAEWVLAHPARAPEDRVGYRGTKASAEKLLKRLR